MAHVRKRMTAKREARYDVRAVSPDGTGWRTRTFRTRSAAEKYAREIETSKDRGGWVDPRLSARPFDDIAREWLASNPAKRSSSYARDESVLRVHLQPAIGSRAIASITPANVRRLVADWSTTSAPRTVKRNYGVLRAVLAYAVDSEYLAVSPCRGVKLPMASQVACHVVDAEELLALADAIGANAAPMVYLGAVLGLRWAECAGLRVGRLDFLERTLFVTEQVTRGYRGAQGLGEPKSAAGRRTLSVPSFLMDMLARHMLRLGLTEADREMFVFSDARGEPLRYENWRRRAWLPAVALAGLDGLTFHDLRRANATAMVAEGIDLKTAQVRLGHTDPRLTLAVYAQATTAADRDAADRVGNRFTLHG